MKKYKVYLSNIDWTKIKNLNIKDNKGWIKSDIVFMDPVPYKELSNVYNETTWYLVSNDYVEEKDKEIERLNNKVEEFMALYESEREVKEDYRSIIKEVNDRLSTILEINEKYEVEDIESLYSKKWLRETIQELKEILDKGGE